MQPRGREPVVPVKPQLAKLTNLFSPFFPNPASNDCLRGFDNNPMVGSQNVSFTDPLMLTLTTCIVIHPTTNNIS